MNAVTERNCEKNFLSRMGHNMTLHPETTPNFFSLSLFFAGIGEFAYPLNLSPAFDYFFMFLAGTTIFLAMPVWWCRPCQCGFEVIRLPKVKSPEIRKLDFEFIKWCIGFFIVIACLEAFSFFLHDIVRDLVSHSFAHLLSAIAFIGFSPWFIRILALKLFSLCHSVTFDQQKKASLLNDESISDLHELIAFNLKIGNFDVADVQSRKLLRMAEDLKTEHCA